MRDFLPNPEFSSKIRYLLESEIFFQRRFFFTEYLIKEAMHTGCESIIYREVIISFTPYLKIIKNYF
jgi:hypothetical protein